MQDKQGPTLHDASVTPAVIHSVAANSGNAAVILSTTALMDKSLESMMSASWAATNGECSREHVP